MLLLEARDTLTRCLVMTRVKVKVKLKVSDWVCMFCGWL